MIPLLMLAAETAALPPICTERPSKANATCTVPVGHVQIETGLAGWSLTEAQGLRTEVVSVGSTFARVGLSGSAEIQVGVTPYTRVTVKDGGTRDKASGFGDIYVRYKQRLTGSDGPVQVALLPFVKLPTANHDIGNGKAEGGIAVPVSFTLAGPVSMTLGPEVDLLADSDGHGRHAAIVNLVNVSGPIAPRLTLAGELWTNFNFDPDGTVKQASADAAVAYAVSDNLQLDAGANFGLTRETADVETYVGVSVRF